MNHNNSSNTVYYWLAAIFIPFVTAYLTDGTKCVKGVSESIGSCTFEIYGSHGISIGFLLGCAISATIVLIGMDKWREAMYATALSTCIGFSYLGGDTKLINEGDAVIKHHNCSMILFVFSAIVCGIAIACVETRGNFSLADKPRPAKPHKNYGETGQEYAIRVQLWEFEIKKWASANPDRHNGCWPYYDLDERQDPRESYKTYPKKKKRKDPCRTCGGTGRCHICGFETLPGYCKTCEGSRNCYSCNGDGNNHNIPYDR